MIKFAFVFTLSFLYSLPLIVIIFTHGLFSKQAGLPIMVAKHWARSILRLTGVKLKTIGEHHIRMGNRYLFVSNHQSTFDIFSLMSALNIPFSFISKALYFKIPIIGYAMRRIGHIPIVRENIRSGIMAIKLAAQKLKDGSSIIIFPEGTRSEDGQVLPFKPGALKIAELTGEDVEVVPVTLVGTLNVNRKNGLALHGGEVKIILGEPILVKSKLKKKEQEMIAKTLEEIIRKTHERYTHPLGQPPPQRIKKRVKLVKSAS